MIPEPARPSGLGPRHSYLLCVRQHSSEVLYGGCQGFFQDKPPVYSVSFTSTHILRASYFIPFHSRTLSEFYLVKWDTIRCTPISKPNLHAITLSYVLWSSAQVLCNFISEGWIFKIKRLVARLKMQAFKTFSPTLTGACPHRYLHLSILRLRVSILVRH